MDPGGAKGPNVPACPIPPEGSGTVLACAIAWKPRKGRFVAPHQMAPAHTTCEADPNLGGAWSQHDLRPAWGGLGSWPPRKRQWWVRGQVGREEGHRNH